MKISVTHVGIVKQINPSLTFPREMIHAYVSWEYNFPVNRVYFEAMTSPQIGRYRMLILSFTQFFVFDANFLIFFKERAIVGARVLKQSRTI